MKKKRGFLNSLTDFVAGIGANLSQADSLKYNNRYSSITLDRATVSQTYLEHGVIQVLIDQPVDDAFRGGIILKIPEISQEEINDVMHFIDMNEIVETYSRALKWSRLFGGAGIIINTGQDLKKPISLNSINEKTPLAFHPVDRWELSYTPNGFETLDQFAEYKSKSETPYNYYGHVVHKSNVIKLKNKEAPSLIRGQFGGWGVSELEKIQRSYNQYMKHQNVSYELLDEAKVDVFKVNGFNSQITTQSGTQKTIARFSNAAKIKNYQNAVVLDKDDDYEQKQVSFSGLAEILTQIRMQLACDLRMPITKLFGISASGFNSGEDDIENYNCMIESEIRSKCKSGLIKIISICCKKVLGYIPENIDFEYHPLRILTHKDESMIKTEALNRVVTSLQNGLCTSEKAVELLNNENVFSIELDPNESYKVEISDNEVTDI